MRQHRGRQSCDPLVLRTFRSLNCNQAAQLGILPKFLFTTGFQVVISSHYRKMVTRMNLNSGTPLKSLVRVPSSFVSNIVIRSPLGRHHCRYLRFLGHVCIITGDVTQTFNLVSQKYFLTQRI